MDDLTKYSFLYREQKRTEDSLFLVVLPAINYCFEETAVETSQKFSLIYIFVNVYVNKINSNFNAFNFVFVNKV